MGWHHAMNRGIDHQRVFFSAADGVTFLALLGAAVRRTGVEVHVFTLMTNHYHLLVRCPEGGLSEFMQFLGGNYTQKVNERLGRDGPLFRGRFHSVLLESAEHISHVERYVHRNPLALDRAGPLEHYRWSSLRHYVAGVPAPEWLTTDYVVGRYQSPVSHLEAVSEEPTSRSLTSPRLEWAVATAIEEFGGVGDADQRNLGRCVAVTMLDLAVPAVAPNVSEWLGFSSDRTRSMALRRARLRAAASPEIYQIAQRALQIAA
jgi:REP element-mobilizing transposase RayT